jgi:hypothetical protein
MKIKWTDQRLRNLFDRYDRLYWRGKLSGYRVILTPLDSTFGRCDWRKRVIGIDPDKHTSDRELRGTLLHEMVHAAVRCGHTVPFFAQMERLITRGAPVTVGVAETGRRTLLGDVVPRRFRLLRAKMERIENRRQREVLRMGRGLPVQHITNENIVDEFGDFEACTLPWKAVLTYMGHEYGLTDEASRPVNAWARRLIERGRKAHRSARRAHLADQKYWSSGPQSEEDGQKADIAPKSVQSDTSYFGVSD